MKFISRDGFISLSSRVGNQITPLSQLKSLGHLKTWNCVKTNYKERRDARDVANGTIFSLFILFGL